MLSGKILYVVSNKIRSLDLGSKKEKEIYQGSNMRLLDSLNGISERELVMQVNDFEEGKCLIESFDLMTNKFNNICEGEKPTYIPKAGSIFYYKYGKGLYQKKLDSNGLEKLITEGIYTYSEPALPNTLYYPHPPVKIADSELAYYTKDKKIEVYNFLNNTFRKLDVINYEPWAFYGKRNSLICKNRDDNNFYFVNITTLDKEKLDINSPKMLSRSIITVDDYGCLIYSKVRLHFIAEMEDVYIYWVDEKKEEIYLKDVFIHSGIYVKCNAPH